MVSPSRGQSYFNPNYIISLSLGMSRKNWSKSSHIISEVIPRSKFEVSARTPEKAALNASGAKIDVVALAMSPVGIARRATFRQLEHIAQANVTEGNRLPGRLLNHHRLGNHLGQTLLLSISCLRFSSAARWRAAISSRARRFASIRTWE